MVVPRSKPGMERNQMRTPEGIGPEAPNKAGAISIGIRREDKNRWERRAPLAPRHVKELIRRRGLRFCVQPSAIRVFSDEEYRQAGAVIDEHLHDCSIILGVKEMPVDFFEPRKTYLFFSHTSKGQPSNMPILRRLIELESSLIDYEKLVNDIGKRVVSFGRLCGPRRDHRDFMGAGTAPCVGRVRHPVGFAPSRVSVPRAGSRFFDFSRTTM